MKPGFTGKTKSSEDRTVEDKGGDKEMLAVMIQEVSRIVVA